MSLEVLKRVGGTYYSAPIYLVRCTECGDEYRRTGWLLAPSTEKPRACALCSRKKRKS